MKHIPYKMQQEIIDLALSDNYAEQIFIENWKLPSGAYGESCGPT